MTAWDIRQGDCRELLAAMPSDSVTACLCDPPYGLEFMGVAWDTFKDRPKGTARTNNTWGDFGSREHARTPDERGRIQRNKGLALYEFSLAWATEVLRVMKPGGVLMAFGGTRTHHRLMVAIEDAGFEIFDTMMFVYGSGFPKSHDISKAIDKAAGAEREVVGHDHHVHPRGSNTAFPKRPGETAQASEQTAARGNTITAPATPDAATWQGYGTALKPAWEPIVLARKPRRGTYAATALEHGSGALNIDGGRIRANGIEPNARQNKSHVEKETSGYSGAWGVMDRPWPATGRWPANLMISHSPGCVRRGERRVKSDKATQRNPKRPSNPYHLTAPNFDNSAPTAPWGYADADGLETIAAWDCVPDCAVRLLGEQSGERKSGARNGHRNEQKTRGIYGKFELRDEEPSAASSGTAARFFKNFDPPLRFCYSAKSSRGERDSGLSDGERSGHPCVKPLAVTRYLATLLRPPEAYLDDATLLVPFAGSGSEMIGALLAGWRNVVGIELEAEYVAIAEARLTWWAKAMALTHKTEPGAILAAMKGRDINEAVQAELFNGRLP